jgi:hypothetical protein
VSKCDDPEMVKLCKALVDATATVSSSPFVISAALAVLKRSVEAPAPTDTLPGLVMLRNLIKDVEKRKVSATAAIALARYYAEGVVMEQMVELVGDQPVLCDCSSCSKEPVHRRGHAHNCRCPKCED